MEYIDVPFRRYNLYINYSSLHLYLLFYYRGLCIQYRLPVLYTITFEQAMALRLGLGIIIGTDGSSTSTSKVHYPRAQSQEHVYCLMMTSRQEHCI